MIALAPEPIDPTALLAAFTAAAGGCGAIVSFTGLVRGDTDVSEMWLDHHERLTLGVVEELADDVRRRFEVSQVAIVHRIGSLQPGDPIVFVAAAATHRRAAFDAVDFAMDRLKTSVPLWKRETRGDGHYWVDARAADHDDAARWDAGHG
jgi:molybdopterin synthase catalytic subunit